MDKIVYDNHPRWSSMIVVLGLPPGTGLWWFMVEWTKAIYIYIKSEQWMMMMMSVKKQHYRKIINTALRNRRHTHQQRAFIPQRTSGYQIPFGFNPGHAEYVPNGMIVVVVVSPTTRRRTTVSSSSRSTGSSIVVFGQLSQ